VHLVHMIRPLIYLFQYLRILKIDKYISYANVDSNLVIAMMILSFLLLLLFAVNLYFHPFNNLLYFPSFYLVDKDLKHYNEKNVIS